MDKDTSPNFSSEIERLKAELLTARDEIRLKVHLAGMDAKQAWDKLEPQVSAFEAKAEDMAQQAETELEKAAKELVTSVKKLREDLMK